MRARLIEAAASAPFRSARAPTIVTQAVADDAVLERLWQEAQRRRPAEAAEAFVAALSGRYRPATLAALVERLRDRSTAHHRAQADALLADGSQLPDTALFLREQSALRYGVDPLISACFARVLAHQYPADPPATQHERGRASKAAGPATATSSGATTQPAHAGSAAPPTRPWLRAHPTIPT